MNTLASILSSRARAEFFRLLFGVERQALYLREIERQTGLAIGTVRQEAAKLLQLNLITGKRDGNRVYFKANIKHPLFVDINNMVLKTIGLVDVIRNAIAGADIDYAFVFGSFARGSQKPDSDIDLFVIGSIGFRTLSKLLRKPGEQLMREINSNVMDKTMFMKRIRDHEHFVTSVMQSKKLMVIGSEDELKRLGE